MVITYIYDPLYRLTAADYSTGDPSSPLSAGFYHYTYDEVGNRLTEETHLESHEYVYDVANRLSSVDSVNYTFDDNGNLLDDGVSTYSYDAANRLTSDGTISYTYNGLGDRYEQTVSTTTTTYILDLNAGLTQVLDDGDSTYLYGLGRIAQINTETEYFMGDALGSVRQLVEGGDIVLAKSYAPYGEDLYSTGSGESAFAFTGEQTDPNGLVYLRARYYGPSDGRFLSRDTWDGDVNRPLSLNRWMYVEGNPITKIDPSGNCLGDKNDINNPDYQCWKMLESIENTYTNVHIFNQEKWDYNELFAIKKALAKHIFIIEILTANELNFYRGDSFGRGTVAGATQIMDVGEYNMTIYDYAYNAPLDANSSWGSSSILNFEGTIIHELTHVAIRESPSILESYKAYQKEHKNLFQPSSIGHAYNWSACASDPSCDPDEERLAIATTVWHLAPDSFETVFYTDWRKHWLQSFYSLDRLNPFEDICYGSYK